MSAPGSPVSAVSAAPLTAPAEVRLVGTGDPMDDPFFRRELANRYLIFDAHVGGARRVDLHPLVLSPEMHAAAVQAAESVGRVVDSAVAARARADEEERARYGLHADVLRLAAASHAAGDDATLMRVDLLLDEDLTWRACEVNADCPGGYNEALGLPKLAQEAGFQGGINPTSAAERVAARLAQLAEDGAGGRGGDGAVAFLYATAYAEDLQVCALFQRLLAERGVDAVLCPPTAPQCFDGDLYVGSRRVTAAYRYFPAEYMEGQRNLAGIAEAVSAGRVRTLANFAQIFTQSKLALARAWAMCDTLDPLDEATVRVHIPESYDVAEVPIEALRGDRERWVVKRALGRVGDDVFVGTLIEPSVWARVLDEVLALRARGERWIAQRFVRQRPVPTPWGDQFVTLGAYLIDGNFAGYFARVTPVSHVSHDALVVPVFTDLGS